jgi:hypothetical protein
MLCKQCQQREATVHVVVVSWPFAEVDQHLCETCYTGAEASRTERYGALPTDQLPTKVEHIAATEYLRSKRPPVITGLRARFRRKYVRHLFAAALDLAARHAWCSYVKRHPVRLPLVRLTLAVELGMVQGFASLIGVASEWSNFFRLARKSFDLSLPRP